MTLEDGTPDPGVARALQPGSAAQGFEDAGTGRVLCRMESQKQETICPKVSAAVQRLPSRPDDTHEAQVPPRTLETAH